jgi:hypothetical protein
MMKLWACVLFAAVAVVAQPASAEPTWIATDAHASKTPWKAGDAALVEWHGSWWKAHVLATLPDGRVVVHYDGWCAEWDELVQPPRAQRYASVTAGARAGGALLVEWKGSFWKAHVLGVERGQLTISYDGYGHEWDETIDRSRTLSFTP